MTLFQLLCEYWELRKYYKDIIYGFDPYYWWVVVNCWIMEFLREKWPKRLPLFLSLVLKMDELDQEYDLTIYSDSEQYFENLVRRKKAIQKRERKNYRRYSIMTWS